MRSIPKFLGLMLLIYVSVGTALYAFQRNLLYFPTPEVEHPYATKQIHVDGETIEVIVLNPGKERALLYFGGNAEPVARNGPEFTDAFSSFSTYLINYRGFGGSSGSPSEQALLKDALILYDHVAQKAHSSISAMGRSLGTGIATYVAAKKQIERLVLVTPYDSIESVAKTRYFIYPVALMIKDRFDTISQVDNVNAPVLAVLAENDSVVPAKHSHQLIDAFPPEQVKVHTIKNANHISLSKRSEYLSVIRQFLG